MWGRWGVWVAWGGWATVGWAATIVLATTGRQQSSCRPCLTDSTALLPRSCWPGGIDMDNLLASPQGLPQSTAESQGVWGDKSRRHKSIEVSGPRAAKTGADYEPSTAISRIPAWFNFHVEIKITKCMRGTAVGLVVPTMELDRQWSVSRVLKSDRDARRRVLDEALQHQGEAQAKRDMAFQQLSLLPNPPARVSEPDPHRRKEDAPRLAAQRQQAKAQQAERRKAMDAEFALREKLQDVRKHVAQCTQALAEAEASVHSTELEVQDRWGPRVWYLSCDGLFGVGSQSKDTGASFTDGDIVRLDLENNRLVFSINGKEIPETVCSLSTRTFFAVCLQNKGAVVEVLESSLKEIEHLQQQPSLEDTGAMQKDDLAAYAEGITSPNAQAGVADAIAAPTVASAVHQDANYDAAMAAADAASPLLSPSRRGRSIMNAISGARALLDGQQQSYKRFDECFLKIAEALDDKWEHARRVLSGLDPNGENKVDRNGLEAFLEQFHLVPSVIGLEYDQVWGYLDEDGVGHIDYHEFIHEAMLAADANSVSDVTWKFAHDDYVLGLTDTRCPVITATGAHGRAAFVSRVLSKGRHRFEFEIRSMSGSLFIGLLQVKLNCTEIEKRKESGSRR